MGTSISSTSLREDAFTSNKVLRLVAANIMFGRSETIRKRKATSNPDVNGLLVIVLYLPVKEPVTPK